MAGIANCIVLELEFRYVQLQYLWNGNYKILMTENQPSCLFFFCFFLLYSVKWDDNPTSGLKWWFDNLNSQKQTFRWFIFFIIYINTVKRTCQSYINTSKLLNTITPQVQTLNKVTVLLLTQQITADYKFKQFIIKNGSF